MKNKIITYSFVIFISIFMILSVITKKDEISISERRHLANMPKFTLEGILDKNNSYSNKLNDYLMDHFIGRETFKKIKSFTSNYIFQNKENHGVFENNGYLFQLDYEVNNASLKHLSELICEIDTNYLTTQNKYFVMIPDKNYYLKNNDIPKLNYEKMENFLKENIPNNTKWIDIKETLNLSSYYYTDIHWKQEILEPTLKRLQEEMKLSFTTFPTKKNEYSPFYGALYGKYPKMDDVLTYLTNEIIENSSVYNYEKKSFTKVYQEKNLNNVDSYDIFLEGPTPILIIDNPIQKNNKSLIMFRDSFGSSLAPLLIENYSKITLIDLRYVSSKMLSEIKDIDLRDDSDVLFLYSVPIINNSFALK